MRITLVISSLGPGGAERVMSMLASHWAEHGEDVTLLTLAGPDFAPFHPLHPAVRLVQLCLSRNASGVFAAVGANLGRITCLRTAIADSSPDVVISFMDSTNVLTLLACRKLRVPVIVSERTVPALAAIGPAWKLLRRLTYPKASAIVVQTRAATHAMPRRQRPLAQAIANPVKPCAPERPDGSAPPKPLLAAAGRLVPLKGFDTLLRAFARTRAAHPDWSLAVYGEGPQREDLERLRDELGLGQCVLLPGLVANLPAHLAQADAFALTSRHEGFPNVLLEAMSCGLAVVSADCPHGPKEIVSHEQNGLLVPPEDARALAEALSRLMSDPALRSRLGGQARQVQERFSEDRIMDLWNQTIRNVLRG